MVRDREKMSSILDSAAPKHMYLAKSFKNVFNNCKNAGLCNVVSHLDALNSNFSLNIQEP
jgi:hypothetical protein